MAIIKKKQPKKQFIDLDGVQGNAFYLLGVASRLARDMDLDGPAILEEMKSSDYENLILVFDKHFGHLVDLKRS